MKKLIVFALLLVACHRSSPNTKPDPNVLGSPTARAAVSAYLDAVIAQDLQAMSAVFGTQEGSVRKTKPDDVIMKSDVVIATAMKCVQKDYSILADGAAAQNKRAVTVQLKYIRPSRSADTKSTTALTRLANFVAVSDQTGRWFVESFNLSDLMDMCLRG